MRSLLNKSKLLLGIALGCLLAACDTPVVYHSYRSLPSEGWKKSDTLSFRVSVADSLPTTFRLFVEVRNRTEYPYLNLSLLVGQNFSDSTKVVSNRVDFTLATAEGDWTGRGWGSLYQSERLARSVRTQGAGEYTVTVCSGMKDEQLPGINDIGIRIER
ncbi:MAG: gliding motility lipoprotein GldH [Mediterranea sp.]|jgi:gliding motility-associated lipoprotein GldH|nr:gliding motility lipoprotein GldH [Mediterranea sp.]